ncbi:MAG: hypothetical protein R3B72_39060 [Polyangiaceae bacterium]
MSVAGPTVEPTNCGFRAMEQAGMQGGGFEPTIVPAAFGGPEIESFTHGLASAERQEHVAGLEVAVDDLLAMAAWT